MSSGRSKGTSMVEFDTVLKEIGECGKAQIIQYLLLCLCVFNAGLISTDVVFFSAKPKHHCAIPPNVTEFYQNVFPNASTSDLLPIFIPEGSSCLRYEHSNGTIHGPKNNLSAFISYLESLNRTTTKCDSWTYSSDVYGLTFVNELNLVCDDKWQALTVKMLFFGGRLFGAVVLGQLSDRFGRLPIFLLNVVLNVLSGIGLFFSSNVISISVFLFIHGIVQVGFMLTCFVLGTELVGPKYRKWFGIVLQIWYAAAMVILPGLSLLLPNWHHLALISTIPSALFLSYAIIVKESPRWLVTRGRNEDALNVLKHFAKTNGKTLSKETEELFLNQKAEKPDRLYTFMDLLKTCDRAKLSLNVWFNWVTNSLVYYGIIFNLDNLGPNPYLNMAILGLVEFPAYSISIHLLDKIGRKRLLISSLFFAGFFCVICGFLPTEPSYLITIFAMLGKFGITISYGVIYFFTAELYPTCVRNLAVGMGSTFARVGGTLSNPILSLQDTGHRFLPMLIFGVMSLVAGGLSLLIPETRGTNLRNTFDDEKLPDEEAEKELSVKLVQNGCEKEGV